MSFYGNITDTSRTHFQFDKIFANRAEMERQLVYGTDGIFAGRFVLVKYDPESNFFSSDILLGYKDTSSDIMYADSSLTVPYVYTTFSKVNSPVEDDWAIYYYKDRNFFFKLPSKEYFSTLDAAYYYTADTNATNVVGEGQIVRLRAANGVPTDAYYKCLAGTSGEPANWEILLPDEEYNDYFINYNIDSATYGPDFDIRGYDATVWQKVYGEGKGKFVLVAHLNGLVPSIELFADAPSEDPSSPYIDAQSTDSHYRIHVPSHYGFRIKEAEDPELSDKILTSSATGQPYNADIYLNFGGTDRTAQENYHKVESHKDTTTTNEISLTPTGESGKVYYDKQGNVITKDILELSIHAPVIGNMVDDGYDVIYGAKEPDQTTGIQERARDIAWYPAGHNLRVTGDSSIGGKTYDLNTLAGTLNTFHQRLGQNIVYTYEDLPTSAVVAGLSDQYIYYIKNLDAYYRKGVRYSFEEIADSEISFRYVALTEQEFISNTYYTTASSAIKNAVQNGQTEFNDASLFIAATTFNSNNYYFVKNIKNDRYKEVNLTLYQPNTYYFQQDENYYIDQNLNTPTSYSAVYYKAMHPTTGRQFTETYVANTYYHKDDDDNYTLASETLPESGIHYYIVTATAATGTASRIYQSNKYYIQNDDNSYTLDTAETLQEDGVPVDSANRIVLTFDPEPKYGLDTNGNFIVYYSIQSVTPVVVISNNPNMVYYYTDINNTYYRKAANLTPDELLQSRYYYTISETDITNDLFIPGQYWEQVNNNGYIDYIKAYTLDTGATYCQVQPELLDTPFYRADTYYWESGTDFYVIDTATAGTAGRTYYTKDSLYVISDPTGRVPVGYEWNDFSLFIPASVTLGIRTEYPTLILMDGVIDDSISIHGALLQLDKQYNPDDIHTRDMKTLTGGLNKINDLLWSVKHLIPGRILYVNEFGQITSSDETVTYAKLKQLLCAQG